MSNSPQLVFIHDLVPDLVLIDHLLGGGDGLKLEGGEALHEPGLLLLDGDPGIVLLGVNQSGLGILKHQVFISKTI